ncbi:MAG TPA: trans-aconitate methyltransferase, partial [Actinopolymorphaceae bacterium]
ALVGAGCQDIDVWETTYSYVLEGPDPVFEWVKGTAARPYLQHLPEDLRPAFEEAYKERLRAVYPARPYGTVLDYRRIFAVAYKKEDV